MTPTTLAITSVIIGFFPFISALLAHSIAGLKGVGISEANPQPCYVLGVDIGDLLYAMTMMIWLIMATIPLMFIGLIASGIWYLYS